MVSVHIYINTPLPLCTVLQRPTASFCGLKIHFICCSGSLQSFYKPKRHLFCQAGVQSLILIDSTWFVSLSCQSYLRIPSVICSTSPLPIHVAFCSYEEKTSHTPNWASRSELACAEKRACFPSMFSHQNDTGCWWHQKNPAHCNVSVASNILGGYVIYVEKHMKNCAVFFFSQSEHIYCAYKKKQKKHPFLNCLYLECHTYNI